MLCAYRSFLGGDVHDGGFRETLSLLCFSKIQDLRGQLLKNSLILSKTCFRTFLKPMFLSKVCFRALSRNRCFWTRREMLVRKFNTRHWHHLILGPIGFPSRDAIAHSIFSFASGRALTFIFEQRVTHRPILARADQAPVLRCIASIFLDLTFGRVLPSIYSIYEQRGPNVLQKRNFDSHPH